MSDHLNEQMNALFRRAAGKGGFRVHEAEESGSQAMNRIIRGQPPAAAPEPEAEPKPVVWHDGDASAGLGERLPRAQPPTMDDVLRGDHRAARRERQEEAETARLEREQSRQHRSW